MPDQEGRLSGESRETVWIKDWRSCQDRQSCAPVCVLANLFSMYPKLFNKVHDHRDPSTGFRLS